MAVAIRYILENAVTMGQSDIDDGEQKTVSKGHEAWCVEQWVK